MLEQESSFRGKNTEEYRVGLVSGACVLSSRLRSCSQQSLSSQGANGVNRGRVRHVPYCSKQNLPWKPSWLSTMADVLPTRRMW